MGQDLVDWLAPSGRRMWSWHVSSIGLKFDTIGLDFLTLIPDEHDSKQTRVNLCIRSLKRESALLVIRATAEMRKHDSFLPMPMMKLAMNNLFIHIVLSPVDTSRVLSQMRKCSKTHKGNHPQAPRAPSDRLDAIDVFTPLDALIANL